MKLHFPKPRRSSRSRVKAGIYVPTHMDTPERWPRPKWISRMFRPPRGSLFMFPIIWSGNPCVALTELLYPDGTVSTGSWDSSPHARLDSASDAEVATGTPAFDQICPTIQQLTICRVAIKNPASVPGSSACQSLRIESRFRLGGTDCSGGCGRGEIILRQGATAKSSQTEQTVTGACSFTSDMGITLSDAQLDAITDHNDLNIDVGGQVGNASAKLNDVTLQASFARIRYEPK